MPQYQYLARDERGKALSGTMAAASPEALAEQLRRSGYFVTRTQEVRPALRLDAWLSRLQRVSYDELVLLNVQLAKLVKVGIPLVTALNTLEAQTDNRRLREALGRVADDVEGGRGLADSLARHPAVFSSLFVSSVRAGEASGKLDEILARLARFHQQQAELRQQLKTALTYPCLLLIMGAGIVTFLVTGIIPQFLSIFEQGEIPLPLPTLLLRALSQALRRYWLLMGIGLIGLGVAFAQWRRTPLGRRQWDAWLLALPVVGSLVRLVALARFARTFETLLSSGVPILEALAIAEQTAGNLVIAQTVRDVQTSVRQGGGLAEPLRLSGNVPPMVVQMIAVGESSGTLDHMLREVADHYDQLVGYRLKRVMALVEPLFLVIMGGIVAFVMASVLLPLFRLVNVIR